MHAGLHSLAHRAPGGATRTSTRVRWQPYNSLPSSISSASISSRSPPTTYLNTPCSVSSSPYSTPATSFDSRSAPPPTPQPKDSQLSKHNKYALGLVDQAVKSLCEIWRPQDIPSLFLTTPPSGGGPVVKNDITSHSTAQLLTVPLGRNTQLPSPVSPSTQHSPPDSSSPPSTSATQCEQEATCMFGSRSNLVPIKGFVHEVLRRSRTSGCVLQTALCYLEAIRARIPELVQQEKSGQGIRGEPEMVSRITPATAAEIEQDALLSNQDNIIDTDTPDEAVMDTVKIHDADCETAIVVDADILKKPKGPSPPLTPLPPLPSPLLCPRRAFLASLILASKFTQDKCYSNRAWAKLSGLPPREIGRCERALGDALDWRLWVGKTSPPAAQPTTTTAPPLVSRPLARCQSESNLRTATKAGFLVREEPKAVNSSGLPLGNNLRRSSTLPAAAFSLLGSESSSISTPARNLESPRFSDQYMSSPELQSLSMIPGVTTQCPLSECDATQAYCPPTEVINPYPSVAFSPCPSLSYSPSSTESSSGDRTIQMSTFSDDNMLNNSAMAPTASESWPWLESPPSGQTLSKVSPNLAHNMGGGVQIVKQPPNAMSFGYIPQLISGLHDVQIHRFAVGQEYLHPNYPNPGIGAGAGLWNGEPFWSTVQ